MNAIEKLKFDTQRFCTDNGYVYGFMGFLKLYFVVDFWPVLWFRLMEYSMGSPLFIMRVFKIILLFFRPFVDGFSSARLRPGAKIGPGLLLHQSVGVVVCSEAEIGENCTLFSGASVVHRVDNKGAGAPRIGNNVSILIGSTISGAVSVGDNVIVGANSVVLSHLPENSVAVGSPARVVH